MKSTMMAFAVVAGLMLGTSSGGLASPARDAVAKSMDDVATTEIGARKKAKKHHARRDFRRSYGYERGFRGAYPGQGYYRGIAPGYNYGPDVGDRAWPPFHFRPYY